MADYKKDDFYKRKAREEEFPSRSIYKLQEIDKKYNLIKKGDRVLDLGCAPGSWLLYLSRKIGDKGKVVGVDISDIQIQLPKNAKFLKKDIGFYRREQKIPNSGFRFRTQYFRNKFFGRPEILGALRKSISDS